MVYHWDGGTAIRAGLVYRNGGIRRLGTNDYGAVLIGYGENIVVISDPISGQVAYDRQQFETVFLSRNSQCVILQEGTYI